MKEAMPDTIKPRDHKDVEAAVRGWFGAFDAD